jgi:hypothetical protein
MGNEVHYNSVQGASQMINVVLPTSLKYVAEISQSGTDAPVPTIILDELVSPITFSYVDIGKYDGTLIGAFPSNKILYMGWDNSMGSAIAGNLVQGFGVNRKDDDSFRFASKQLFSNGVGIEVYDEFQNDLLGLQVNRLHIELSNISQNSEEEFNGILNKLDVNLTKIWISIVVRLNGIVTFVDGNKYRNTGVFATSSKIIES